LRFAQSYYIYGLWGILALVIFFIWAAKKKRLFLRKFAEEPSLAQIASCVNFKAQGIRAFIIISAFVLSLLALMRPQWGFQWQEVKRMGLDILIAVDTSNSMLATDIKPNRLQRSKLAVRDLVKKLRGDRVGLIAFSGTAFLHCPLTIDYNGFLLALNDLGVKTIPRGGTSIEGAIMRAIRSYEGGAKKYKVLIIITDGEYHEGDPIRAAEEAAKENIKIFCVGVGTNEGELIWTIDEDGKRRFLKDRDGTIVKSRLNENVLRKIALITRGMYVRSSGAEFGLDLIYEKRLSKMEKREIKAQMAKRYKERFQIPLGLAVALLAIEPLINDRKKR